MRDICCPDFLDFIDGDIKSIKEILATVEISG